MKLHVSPFFQIEALEARQLLSGVTILIHGYQSDTTGWVKSAATAISQRVAGGASQYVMNVETDDGHAAVTAFKLQSGAALGTSQTGEVVVKLDWSAVDSPTYSTEEIGEVIANYLIARHGSVRALAELPIHLIGHSRGASLVVAITRFLAERGVWVDQNTYLDPHPIDGDNDLLNADFGDQTMRVFDNVAFADNYWRTDGNSQNADFDGESVAGSYQGDLNDSVQDDFSGTAHSSVTGYYHGTIDLAAVTNGDSAVRSDWYGGTNPARNQTGFVFSRVGLGKRPTSGLSPQFGGVASRNPSTPVGTQWGNITSMRVLEGSTLQIGPRASLRFLRQDRDGGNALTFFLDRDTNPYNGNNVRTLRRFSMAGASAVTAAKISIITDDVPAGNYYIGGQISDAQGHLKIAYTSQLTFSAAPGAAPQFSKTPIVAPPAIAATKTGHHDRIADLVFTTA